MPREHFDFTPEEAQASPPRLASPILLCALPQSLAHFHRAPECLDASRIPGTPAGALAHSFLLLAPFVPPQKSGKLHCARDKVQCPICNYMCTAVALNIALTKRAPREPAFDLLFLLRIIERESCSISVLLDCASASLV